MIAYIIIFLIGKNVLVSLTFTIIVFVVLHFVAPKYQSNIPIIVNGQNDEEYRKLLIDLNTRISELRALSADIPEGNQKSLVQSITEVTQKIELKLQKDKNYRETKDFVNYYLPTIVRIVNDYNEIIRNNVSNESGIKFKQNVENMLPLFENAVKNQLNDMFNGETLGTNADMIVLKQVMASNGLLNDSFKSEGSK